MKKVEVFPLRAAALVAVCLFAASTAFAQVAGRLTGTVVDAQGAPIPNASVKGYLAGGQQAVLTTSTNGEGYFAFAGVRPEFYDVTIEASGFVKTTLRGVKVDPAVDTNLPPTKLDISSVAETVEVTAEVQSIQTNNAEIATTVTNQQIRNLPVLDRQVINLITTQAGVTDGRGPTVINGMRTSYATVTMDGINIQDNFIRSNGLSFIPNRITVDQVAEVTISTSNANSTVGGGSAQVSFVTPSGTNEYHGNAYWYNRNNAVAANDWFNNADGVEKPVLNQNQLGASLGGPIIKDKLLFYFNYEALRLKQQELANTTILTQDARNGIFTYQDTTGAVRKVNILQTRGVAIDPAIASLLQRVPDPGKANNFRLGDSTAELSRNTVGYSFNKRSNMDRNNITSKVDYILSERQSLSASYLYNSEKVDRPDQDLTFNAVPTVANDAPRHLVSGGWRWTPGSTLTNELRGGFNFSPSIFANTEQFPEYLLTRANTVFTYPVSNTLLPQGRYTDTYSLQDNATWIKGRHTLRFGWQTQMIRVEPYNDAGIYPTYLLGFSSNNQNGLLLEHLPNVRSNDLTAANNLLAALAGYVSEVSQTFNVTSRDSGFVPRASDRRNWKYDNHAFYIQDEWKATRNLSLNLGLRYEYFTQVDESNGLALLPKLNGNYINSLLDPNAVLDFAGGSTGIKFYNKDLNNFAPSVGLAWNVFGKDKGQTVLRAGYGISYVNDDHIVAVRNTVVTNSGLSSSARLVGQTGRLSTGRPAITTPQFKVPLTFRENNLIDPAAAFGYPDPTLRTPYVQQWNFGIQQDIKGFVFEARVVGNKGTKLLRAFDYNQVNINASGFLDDFKRARNNGFLSKAANGTFNPNYNANIPGSVPLTVFPQFTNGGNLNATNVRSLIETGEVGTLAQTYFTTRVNGPVQFFANPYALALNTMTNYSNSSYNSLQLELRKRTTSGFQLQTNYTFGKVLSDAAGDGQTRFEPFLDFTNSEIERARAPFDLNHAFKANFVYELPIGKGTRFDVPVISRVLSGWKAGGFITWQSGTPFSVFSDRGTYNRGARSTTRNTATAIVDGETLAKNVGFFQTGNGPYFINPSAIGGDGRGVSTDGSAPFAGQMFANPGPGEIGKLQRRMFSGPSVFNMDFSAGKTTQVTERTSVEFRMEAFNVFNNASFYVGDEIASSTRFNVNQPTFGVITSSYFTPRVMQFGLYIRF